MPAKKTARKKQKKAPAARRKVAAKKPASRKKPVSKKRKVTKKKPVAKKSPKKKTVTRKKAASSKKKVAKKKPATKKKVAKKKPVSRKKVAKKKPAAKKTAKKKVSKKKPVAKKAPSRKKIARKAPAPKKAAPKKARTRGDVLSGPIHGVKPYVARRSEGYMNKAQLAHFEDILSSWKHELMNEVDRTVHHMQDEAANFPDPNDRATQESEFGLELRTRDRERKLLRKINSALTRIEEGTYGYCDETGEEIGLKRLEARPVATLCLEAQERREMAERQFRDRDDRYR